jgi:pyruvate formate lyase activating enzyme
MKESLLYTKHKDNKIKCNLCAHYCELKNGQYGICGVRQDINGILYSLNYGLVQETALDPVEKKPFYHFIPGSLVLSFGLPGCNFHCANCQNSNLSQNIKAHRHLFNRTKSINPEMLINYAIQNKIDGIAYTYSEPTIFFEYAYDTIMESRQRKESSHLKHMFISNGYFSKELRDKIFAGQLLDAVNIDLKFMDDRKYKKITGGTLQPVLDNIEAFAASSVHLEIINLVIPDENNSDDDFRKLAAFLSSVDKDIPLHFSRFFPYNKMLDRQPTPVEQLRSAKHIAEEFGMKYVYIGNVASKELSDTFCPSCHALLIKRHGYNTNFVNLKKENDKYYCSICGCEINIK